MYPSWPSTRRTASHVPRTLRFVLAAVVFSRIPAELPSPAGATPACGPASLRVVRLLVVNEAAVPRPVLDAAALEADSIWATAGVRLEWTFTPKAFDRLDDDTVILLLRPTISAALLPDPFESADAVRRRLGQVRFGPNGQPGKLIEVSLEAIASLVMTGTQFDHRVTQLPAISQRLLIGRGLGRVVAHELGHWLAGRGHARSGVMKARFGAGDLVATLAPVLPRAWAALLGGTVRARSSRCDAVRQ